MTLREKILRYAEDTFGTTPEYLWPHHPTYAVLRHSDNGKWYAAVMEVPASCLGFDADEAVDILNVKCGPILSGSLRIQEGIYPAYHMNKANWISVLLDGTVDEETVLSLIGVSFDMTCSGKSSKNSLRRREWLVPANPKFFDIDAAINETDEHIFMWKQSSSIAVGDTVYMYVAAPVSAIRYKCVALEVDIPHIYSDENVQIKRLMRLQLIERYDKTPIDLDIMREHGVLTVRGPRGIPTSLIEEIEYLYRK